MFLIYRIALGSVGGIHIYAHTFREDILARFLLTHLHKSVGPWEYTLQRHLWYDWVCLPGLPS